jgi:uncharacterized tellurite resistance protein B-like protein
MTPQEKTIVKLLVAVAWADGEMQAPEEGVIEGLLGGFDATPQEEAEIVAWSKSPRALRDVPVGELSADDRETLMRNAALLVCADDDETEKEKNVLAHLASILDIGDRERGEIVASVRAGIRHLHRGDRGDV